MTGRTVPCFDLLGFKQDFSPTRPWLFQDFDLITYYAVSEAELDEKLALFRSGRYKFEWEEVEFDMGAHNSLLRDTSEEVRGMRAKQAAAQDEMVKAENESLARWRVEKSKNKVDESMVDKLLDDPAISTIEAPVDANVWKIQVSEGDEVTPNQTIAILEAMKLEMAVNAPEDLKRAKVEKLLVQQGETIRAGGRIALLRSI